jgi:hypothetical protein
LCRTISIGEIVVQSDLEEARFEEVRLGRILTVETGDHGEVSCVETTLNKKVNHVGGGEVFGVAHENSTETDDIVELVVKKEDRLLNLLFGPVAAKADGRGDVTGMGVMDEIEKGMVTIGIGARTIVIVRVGGESAILLDKTRDVVEPMEVFRRFGRREINAKNKTIIVTGRLVKEFVRDNEIATGESMVGEGSIPGPKGSDMRMRTSGRLFSETLVVALAFKNGTIAEDDAGADNGRIHIIVMFGTIGPFKGSESIEVEDLVGIVVIIVSLFDGGRQCIVVKDVRRRVDVQGSGRNG